MVGDFRHSSDGFHGIGAHQDRRARPLHRRVAVNHFIEMEMFSMEGHRVSRPKLANHFQSFDQSASALPYVDTE
jgi:hypothetical protein